MGASITHDRYPEGAFRVAVRPPPAPRARSVSASQTTSRMGVLGGFLTGLALADGEMGNDAPGEGGTFQGRWGAHRRAVGDCRGCRVFSVNETDSVAAAGGPLLLGHWRQLGLRMMRPA
jgi:hypothetical protein